MTIDLPDNIERSLEAAVQAGRFASMNDAMAEAARLLVEQIRRDSSPLTPGDTAESIIGIFRDAPEEIDDIVAEAMERRQRLWRDIPIE